MSKNEEKYLSHYAEPEAQTAHALLRTGGIPQLTHGIVVPVFDESPTFLDTLTCGQPFSNSLFILVINTPTSQPHSPANHELFAHLKSTGKLLLTHNNLTLLQWRNTHLLIVDRFSTLKIPHKQGVGLARKIGCDIAVALFNGGVLNNPWIFSTDADVQLPNNYFAYANTTAESSAQVFNFQHVNDTRSNEATFQATFQATQQYEQALKYYRQQLRWAGSPYAFYTLGSTLAVHIQSYCKVRGFPKRAGGEDFYLLNKLAKVGNILSCDEVVVKITARESHRVPFGTGPATKKIVEQNHQGLAYHYYHPHIFSELKAWLSASTSLWPPANANQILATLSPECNHALTLLDLPAFLKHAEIQCKTAQVFLKSFNDWFDAFITLKFIHALQEHYYAPLPLTMCIALAHEKKGPQDGN